MNTIAEQSPPAGTVIVGHLAGKPSFGDIPLACIRASKTNPRKIFDDGHLQDLAKSVKAQGIAQPILVRPIETIGEVTYFEIVAGERRFRASGIAGMLTVPAIVRELSDQEAYEIQVLENLQRVDLHPLEEAEGFEVMMKTYKVTADQLAEKVGKSKAYIYASLKLCELEAPARKAFYDGSLTKSTALLVARIPVKALQLKCVKDVTEGYQPMSTRHAAEHIERTYMLHLKKATFKPSDADLVPAAGSCTACPKRTGNQPEVFTDVNADVCTDPGCFKTKGEAHVIRIKQLATANGQTVFSGADAKKIMPSSYGEMKGYVDLDKPNYQDAKSRTWRQILGKDVPAVSLLESPHDETIRQIVKVVDVAPLLKAKGISTTAKTSAEEDAARDREKAQEADAKIEREYRRQLFLEVHHSALMMNLVDVDLRLIAFQLFDRLPSNVTSTNLVMELHGWTSDTLGYPDRHGKLRAAIEAFTPAQLNQFIRDCVLAHELDVNTYTSTSKDEPAKLLAYATRTKVDAKKIRGALVDAAKAKADAKKKAADKKQAKTAPAVTPPPPAKSPVAKKVAAKTTTKTKPAPATANTPDAKPPTEIVPEAAWPFPSAPNNANGSPAAVPAAEKKSLAPAWPFPTTSRTALPPAAPSASTIATPTTQETK